MAIPQLLEQLLITPGPSGNEAKAAKVWRDGCATFASEVDVDNSGSSWARVPGSGPAPARPCLAVVGHIDEIGVRVTHIDDNGFLRFGGVGGWDPVNLLSQRIVLDTKHGQVRGVIGRKAIHLMDDEDRKKAPELKGLHIDIGAADAEEAAAMVRVGDTGVIDAQPLELPNGRVASRALDNRVGCYVAARAAQLIAEDGGAPGDVLALAVVQEEIGLNGSATSAYRHRPDVGIAVDVTHATDTPGIELDDMTHHKLGTGPVISRGPQLHPRVFELLADAAQEASIPYTIESAGRTTGTDADRLHVSRAGIPTGLVSVPLRYMHSSVEVIDLQDLENAAKLIAAFAMRLQPGTSFAR